MYPSAPEEEEEEEEDCLKINERRAPRAVWANCIFCLSEPCNTSLHRFGVKQLVK
jgi:hypothetical protein